MAGNIFIRSDTISFSIISLDDHGANIVVAEINGLHDIVEPG
jgi:hypothetical protein